MSRMKWRWANGLRVVAGISVLSGMTQVYAQTATDKRAEAAVEIPPAQQINTRNVVEIRVVTEDGRVLSDCPRGVSVEVGKPLDPGNVAASLRALYRSGDYSDLRAVVTEVDHGIRLDFIAKENLFFNQVIIEGLSAPPTDASAAAAMQLNLGDIYRASAVEEGLQRLRDALRDEGLYLAAVTADAVPHPATHQMDMLVHVKPGPRARVGEIHLTNGTEFTAAEIVARTKIKVGKELTSAHLQ